MKKLTLSLLALALFVGSNVEARCGSCCPKKEKKCCVKKCKKNNCGCGSWCDGKGNGGIVKKNKMKKTQEAL